jgi:hypothetical protein
LPSFLLHKIIWFDIPSFAQAHGLTHIEVRQQLIEVEVNGLRLVTETSYPDAGIIDAQSPKRGSQQDNDVGGSAANISETEASHSNKLSHLKTNLAVREILIISLE